ncbi:MAG: hypothetical protein QOI76_3746 [Frankiales bacterium]|nr:hypothetical protein [Frankiales bacterium]
METDPERQWLDDSAALSVAPAELGLLTEDDLLGDGDTDVEGFPVAEWSVAELTDPQSSVTQRSVDPWSATQWSVAETLAQVAACPPGSEPIGWLTALDGRPLTRGQALAVAGAWERQARWVTARQQGSWIGFVGPTAPGPLGPDGPSEADLRGESSDLLELALTVDYGIDFTRDKVAQARLLAGTLCATRDRLAAGELSEYRARRIAEELRNLDPVTAREIEAKVLGTAAEVRVPTLVRRLRRLVLVAQGPEAVAAHLAGLAARRVVVDTEGAEVGLLGLHAYLPPEQTIAIRELLETKAKELARADRAARDEVTKLNRARANRNADGTNGTEGAEGDDGGPLELPVRRSKDQRMADALAMLLLGADEADPARPAKPKVLVQVTIDLPTLLHLREHPGELAGYGPIPAEIARELADDASWQRLVYEPVTGYLLDLGDELYEPGAAITVFRIARDVRCRFPGSSRSARLAEGDHVKAHRKGGGGGRTCSQNIQSLAKLGHIAKTHNGWHVSGDANGELTWTSPNGATYPSTPYDYRPEDDPPPF